MAEISDGPIYLRDDGVYRYSAERGWEPLLRCEPLGREFERVLYDNLSSLYVRDTDPGFAPMQWYLDQLGDA